MRTTNQKPQPVDPTPRPGFSSYVLRTHTPFILRNVLVMVLAAMCLPTSLFAQESRDNAVKPAGGSIQGEVRVASPDGRLTVLPGVALKLIAVSPEGSRLTARSDAQGHYEFSDLKPATYRLEAAPAGFKPFVETIALGLGELQIANVRLQLASVTQTVEVRDQAPTVAQQGAAPAARLIQQQILTLPLARQKFTDALPLTPSVIRTPDGQLSMKGSPENNGMLLLDSAQLVDPVTGSFAVGIPVEAIQTLAVNETPYSAEYGGFSGGLTAIQTKPPSGQWHYGLMAFIPGIRGKAGHIVGIADWTPRLTFGGPLLENKLNFSESFAYEKQNQPVRGLAWPHNETQTQGFNSFTNLQAILSPRHLLAMNVDVFPLRTQFADINSLVPQSASSNYGQKGVSAGATDSYQFNSGALLSTVFRYTRFDSNAYGQGPQDMLITPEGWGGNFFNAWTRAANQFELLPAFQLPPKEWHGHHELQIGADFTYRSYSGRSVSHPIGLLRQDGSLAETISFGGQGLLGSHAAEVAEFIQDRWTVNGRLAFNLGGRMTSQEEGRKAAFAPRAGLVFALDRSQKTILRTGAGLFYDRVPLLAMDFNENPMQVITPFSSLRLPSGPLELFPNECVKPGGPTGVVSPGCNFGTSPRNFTWNVEVERQLRRNLYLRVGYLYSETENLFVVNPSHPSPGSSPALALSPTGGSHYDDFEVTLHYQPGEFDQLNVSYIHSRAQGNLNSLTGIFAPFEEPVIRPDAVANLNFDVPDRLISWGEFHLPWRLTFSPVVDIHTGFPYSNVDVLQKYVGEPNGQRFPSFFSLDVRVYREFTLPVPFISRLKDHKFRFGVYSINVTNHSNPRDVFSNVASPYFGSFVGFQHRVDGLVIDFVR